MPMPTLAPRLRPEESLLPAGAAALAEALDVGLPVTVPMSDMVELAATMDEGMADDIAVAAGTPVSALFEVWSAGTAGTTLRVELLAVVVIDGSSVNAYLSSNEYTPAGSSFDGEKITALVGKCEESGAVIERLVKK